MFFSSISISQAFIEYYIRYKPKKDEKKAAHGYLQTCKQITILYSMISIIFKISYKVQDYDQVWSN